MLPHKGAVEVTAWVPLRVFALPRAPSYFTGTELIVSCSCAR